MPVDVTACTSTLVFILTFRATDPIADDVAEGNLAIFRRDIVRFCPVLYLAPGVTALELRRTRPLLWLSIMACTTRSLKEAHAVGDKLRQVVAHKMVIHSEKNLDLVQGMLVFLQWPHCHRKGRPFFAMWTNLCIAIVQDMGFMATNSESAFTYVKKFWMPKQGSTELPCRSLNSERTMEERRTILALYLWTTM